MQTISIATIKCVCTDGNEKNVFKCKILENLIVNKQNVIDVYYSTVSTVRYTYRMVYFFLTHRAYFLLTGPGFTEKLKKKNKKQFF